MQPIRLLWLSFLLFVHGPTARPADLGSAQSASEIQVRQRLQQIFDAAATKDMDRLDSYHWYGPKFTKFGTGALGRLDAATAREGEHKGLRTLTQLTLTADALKIDVFGDTAVATFIAVADGKRGQELIRSQERSTIVFVKDNGSWKIVHEHFSPFAPPPVKRP
ncbi:MAG: nuclear transport factor 2 family protein [Verrucomicrobiota bacterium]